MSAVAASVGILVALVVGCTAFIFVVRHFKRRSTAANYGIAPEQVSFRCGCASWLFGCFCFWPVVFCPIDVDDGHLPYQRTIRNPRAKTTHTSNELQVMRREQRRRYGDEENQLAKGYSSDKEYKRQNTQMKSKGKSESGSRRSRSESRGRIPESRF